VRIVYKGRRSYNHLMTGEGCRRQKTKKGFQPAECGFAPFKKKRPKRKNYRKRSGMARTVPEKTCCYAVGGKTSDPNLVRKVQQVFRREGEELSMAKDKREKKGKAEEGCGRCPPKGGGKHAAKRFARKIAHSIPHGKEKWTAWRNWNSQLKKLL